MTLYVEDNIVHKVLLLGLRSCRYNFKNKIKKIKKSVTIKMYFLFSISLIFKYFP